MATVQAISFEEVIKNRDTTVRVTDDSMIWAVDLVMAITGKNRDDAGKVLRRIPEAVFSHDKFSLRILPGKGNYQIKLLSLPDAIELVMVLPGKLSKMYRKKISDVIIRYLDGDPSMCHEIVANGRIGKVKSYTKFAQKIAGEVEFDEQSMFGYVYTTCSSAFPGLIKIGKAVDVAKRVSQLNTGCAPAPHIVVAVAPSLDYTRDEKLAHENFANRRREGEFFEISQQEVCDYFKNTISTAFNNELNRNLSSMAGHVYEGL